MGSTSKLRTIRLRIIKIEEVNYFHGEGLKIDSRINGFDSLKVIHLSWDW